MRKKNHYLMILTLLLSVAMPAQMWALSDAAKALCKRQIELYATDSIEAFMDVSERLRAMLEEERDEEQLYNTWFNQVAYTFSNISSNKALTMIDEMKNFANKHDSKYGFYIATFANAWMANFMDMNDRAEELLLQTIDYGERHLLKDNLKLQIYQLLTDIYISRGEAAKSISILDKALQQDDWSNDDRLWLLAEKCNSISSAEPVDTALFMKCYDEMHAFMKKTGYNGTVTLATDCDHAIFTQNFSRLQELAKKISRKDLRLNYEIKAYEGLGQYQKALELYKEKVEWDDSLKNAETRKLTDMSALELQAAKAENEAYTLRLTNHRTILIAIVCGLLLISVFLVIYLRRRQQQIRELKRAYDQLEEVTTQKERIESELRIARNIQMSMVPTTFPDYPGLDLYASMTPAKEVGGDLYSYVMTGDRLYFCVGDVSGKGVPASLFMAQTVRLFRTLAAEDMMPTDIAKRMNNELSEGNDTNMFVTMFIGLLHLDTGGFDFCNAGHNPPIIDIGDGHGDFLDMQRNMALGIFADYDFKGEHIESVKGRSLFVYTDGLNEAEDGQNKQFGEDRMLDFLRHTPFHSARQVTEAMLAEVETHRHGAEPSDDLTLLCLKIMDSTT
jgi:serine phosphatase RsbU (regulator of sigma subunit)